jgi:hypothetical protein
METLANEYGDVMSLQLGVHPTGKMFYQLIPVIVSNTKSFLL